MDRTARPTLIALAGLLLLSVTDPGSTESPRGIYDPDEILIKFKPSARADERALVRTQLGAESLHVFRSGAEHWRLGPGREVEASLEWARGDSSVEYAEPNYFIEPAVIPNDPNYGSQWALQNTGQFGGTPGVDIDAELAWGISTGDPNVIVAVVDTGVDYLHQDLRHSTDPNQRNIWVNTGEIQNNFVDDDNNGYRDDFFGYDFRDGDPDPMGNAAGGAGDQDHGTHLAGIIGALGNNNRGVTGINWRVKIMSLKVESSYFPHEWNVANSIKAIEYATMMGADVINFSGTFNDPNCVPPPACSITTTTNTDAQLHGYGAKLIGYLLVLGPASRSMLLLPAAATRMTSAWMLERRAT